MNDVEPIRRSVTVRCTPERAFRVFTDQMSAWWPLETHGRAADQFADEGEEAAMDLGASPTQALRRVLLPLLFPAIFASVAIVFAASIDNFVISQQLSRDASTQTIPILIYTSARRGPLPSLNALATLTLLASTALIVVAAVVYRRFTRAERRAA